MNKRLIIGFLIVGLIVLGGCSKGISKQEATTIAYNFGAAFGGEVDIMNIYQEGNYWKVIIGITYDDLKDDLLLEINAKTGKVEYLTGNGERKSIEQVMADDWA